ncbi:penicillin-binding transpeptidase domain-containing protein [Pediococcus acidilactici]
MNFVSSEARLYPNGVFASNLIGFAQQSQEKGSDTTQLSGVMGLEKMLNKQLTGTDGEKSLQKDKFGYQLPGSQVERPARDGSTVYTTLDQRLQTIMESTVSKVQSQAHPESIGATIMNAKTGAILATTQRPTFNASTKKGLSKAWNNGLVQDTYEPGSTMKIFTTAAAIDSGNFDPDEVYKSGTYEIDGQVVPDWKREGWGLISYEKGFALSSNVAMAHLEQRMAVSVWLEGTTFDSVAQSYDWGRWAAMVMSILVATDFGGEYENETIDTLFYKNTSRGGVFLAKLLVLLGYVLILSLAGGIFTMVIQATHAPSTLTWDLVVNHQSLWNAALLTGLGASGMVALITVLTIGVTCLTRSKIVAMGFSFVLIFTGPTLAGALPKIIDGPWIKWNPLNMLQLASQVANPALKSVTKLSTAQLAWGTTIYAVIFTMLSYLFFSWGQRSK